MPSPKTENCAHQGCTCQVEAGKGVTAGGKTYCSQECAEGKSCKHPGCGCGK